MARYSLAQVETWLAEAELSWARLGPAGVGLLEALTESDTPAAAAPAVALAHRLCDRLVEALDARLALSEADSARLFSLLLTMLAEVGQYRHETFADGGDQGRQIETLLAEMADVREHVILVAKTYLQQPVFDSLRPYLEQEIFPLLESLGDPSGQRSLLARDRYMPFRVVQVGNIAERLHGFRLRTGDPRLVGERASLGLLSAIYARKVVRFGTSGVRGRWGQDFTEARAKVVVQAICDYLRAADVPERVGAENLQGRRIVIGYDTRQNARLVAHWVAQVCLGNGFDVELAYRDAPTPALVYYMTDHLPEGDVAGLINCTASHNPPEWQGIKFNPRQGFPAPSSLTNFIATRANRLQLLDEAAAEASVERTRDEGRVRGFDPIVHYTNWILESGEGNQRIHIDPQRIRRHFHDGLVVIDEMHGASRGYLTRLLGEIGVRYTVIHAERDPTLPGLDYANPEEPFINDLKRMVSQIDGALLGLGMDTDADRFGVIDQGGVYFRPNQVLPMLIRYLGIGRELKGRVVVTQTGSPLNDVLAGMMPDNEDHRPAEGVVPAFVGHPFYYRRIGERQDRVYENVFMVPVGIKYIEEQRRTDAHYRPLKELPENWRDRMLIGGEESSGLTTRGHVTDKDGIWANLLIMDMMAYYGKSLAEIWRDTVEVAGWESYGGLAPSNSGRVDVDAVLEAKEALINDFLDRFVGQKAGEATLGELPIDDLPALQDLRVIYAGGIRYDFVEIQLRDPSGDEQHYLRVRASGTEPINRIYVESSDPDIARGLINVGLRRLVELSCQQVSDSQTEWRLAEVLSYTRSSEQVAEAVQDTLATHAEFTAGSLVAKLCRILPQVEHRNQRMVQGWIDILG